MNKCTTCNILFTVPANLTLHMQTHIQQNKVFEKHMENPLNSDCIEYQNDIPKIIFMCMFCNYSSTPVMCDNSFDIFKTILDLSDVPIVLISTVNYKEFIKSEYPLHKAFKYLSGPDKTIYFKYYLLHHYGGACCDISLDNCINDIDWNLNKWGENNDIFSFVQDSFKFAICKKNSPFTKELMCNATHVLNKHYINLARLESLNMYVLRESELTSDIYGPALVKYLDNLKISKFEEIRKNDEPCECNICHTFFPTTFKLACHRKEHSVQQSIFSKFGVKNFTDVDIVGGVPKVVFVLWFGGYGTTIPLMSSNRFAVFCELYKAIKVPIVMITDNNYKELIKSEFQLHKSFEYLSGVHKSDYFRCYLLHHYGGGYHDVKSRVLDWKNEWDIDNWTSNDNIWMYGRREKNEGAIGHPPEDYETQKKFRKLVTMGWIICKKNTPYTTELIDRIHKALDMHYDNLVKYPGINSGGYYSDKPFNLVPENSYPIRWLEILGEIYHPLMVKYLDHIKLGLPDAVKTKRYK